MFMKRLNSNVCCCHAKPSEGVIRTKAVPQSTKYLVVMYSHVTIVTPSSSRHCTVL